MKESDKECLFCKIIEGKVSSERVYEDDKVIAFNDIHPKAPIHILVVPRQHIDSLAEIDEKNLPHWAPLFIAAKKIAAQKGVLERGFRVMINCNREGGQLIYHLHLHLLAGSKVSFMG